jgi:DNA-binding NarL/FixJ family response regulator
MIRVFVFDDNKKTLEAVETLLSAENDITFAGASTNTSDAVKKIQTSHADLVIMDIDMPGLNGIESTRLIKAELPEIPILIQTIHDDDHKIFESICAGASGYILKGNFSDKLATAISECYHGGCPMSPAISKKVFHLFSKLASEQVIPDISDYSLTSKEKQVLALMVNGYSIKMLSDKLNISYETGKTHVKHIYQKLHVASRSEAVAKAIKEKLV